MEYFCFNLNLLKFRPLETVKPSFLSRKEVLDKVAKAILTFHRFILDKTLAF